jgi:hypothetical protein
MSDIIFPVVSSLILPNPVQFETSRGRGRGRNQITLNTETFHNAGGDHKKINYFNAAKGNDAQKALLIFANKNVRDLNQNPEALILESEVSYYERHMHSTNPRELMVSYHDDTYGRQVSTGFKLYFDETGALGLYQLKEHVIRDAGDCYANNRTQYMQGDQYLYDEEIVFRRLTQTAHNHKVFDLDDSENMEQFLNFLKDINQGSVGYPGARRTIEQFFANYFEALTYQMQNSDSENRDAIKARFDKVLAAFTKEFGYETAAKVLGRSQDGLKAHIKNSGIEFNDDQKGIPQHMMHILSHGKDNPVDQIKNSKDSDSKKTKALLELLIANTKGYAPSSKNAAFNEDFVLALEQGLKQIGVDSSDIDLREMVIDGEELISDITDERINDAFEVRTEKALDQLFKENNGYRQISLNVEQKAALSNLLGGTLFTDDAKFFTFGKHGSDEMAIFVVDPNGEDLRAQAIKLDKDGSMTKVFKVATLTDADRNNPMNLFNENYSEAHQEITVLDNNSLEFLKILNDRYKTKLYMSGLNIFVKNNSFDMSEIDTNSEIMSIHDEAIELLKEQRKRGTVNGLQDKLKSIYENTTGINWDEIPANDAQARKYFSKEPSEVIDDLIVQIEGYKSDIKKGFESKTDAVENLSEVLGIDREVIRGLIDEAQSRLKNGVADPADPVDPTGDPVSSTTAEAVSLMPDGGVIPSTETTETNDEELSAPSATALPELAPGVDNVPIDSKAAQKTKHAIEALLSLDGASRADKTIIRNLIEQALNGKMPNERQAESLKELLVDKYNLVDLADLDIENSFTKENVEIMSGIVSRDALVRELAAELKNVFTTNFTVSQLRDFLRSESMSKSGELSGDTLPRALHQLIEDKESIIKEQASKRGVKYDQQLRRDIMVAILIANEAQPDITTTAANPNLPLDIEKIKPLDLNEQILTEFAAAFDNQDFSFDTENLLRQSLILDYIRQNPDAQRELESISKIENPGARTTAIKNLVKTLMDSSGLIEEPGFYKVDPYLKPISGIKTVELTGLSVDRFMNKFTFKSIITDGKAEIVYDGQPLTENDKKVLSYVFNREIDSMQCFVDYYNSTPENFASNFIQGANGILYFNQNDRDKFSKIITEFLQDQANLASGKKYEDAQINTLNRYSDAINQIFGEGTINHYGNVGNVDERHTVNEKDIYYSLFKLLESLSNFKADKEVDENFRTSMLDLPGLNSDANQYVNSDYSWTNQGAGSPTRQSLMTENLDLAA